jgi:hypothetical protein
MKDGTLPCARRHKRHSTFVDHRSAEVDDFLADPTPGAGFDLVREQRIGEFLDYSPEDIRA